MLLRSRWKYITCLVALCATASSTMMVLGAGLAAACEGIGGGGGGGGCPAPSVSTGGYDSLTSNSVTLTGSVNPQGCQTYYAFEYGRSSEGYPDEIISSAGSGTSSVTVSTSSAIVQPSTSYHYRLSAWNSGGEVTGGSGSFTTKAACTKPTVTTNVAGSVTDTSAVLSGSVNPNGCQATSKIEWGPSSNPTAYPNVVNGPSGAVTFNVSHTATGLQSGTGYHYRISATNSTGTTPGPDRVFTTPKTKYVALGDSYSAGVGTESYFDTNCYQSSYAYPELLRARHPDWTVVNKTCDSYWTSNVISTASTYLTPDTKWVTYTVGGNDVEFGWTMAYCAGSELSCWPQLDRSQEKIVNELPSKLDAVNNMIKSRAPNAKVIVLDYPKIFNGVSCTGLYTVNEQSNLNATAEMMRNVISTATKRAGANFTFVDVIPAFTGHAVCDGGSGSAAEWINGPSFSPTWSINPEDLLKDSFHPKKAGQQVYYSLVNWITG
jgi:lysophospholipase L1-like esterase